LAFADARLPTALPLPFTPGDFGVPRWLLASKTTIDFEGKQARGWRQELAHRLISLRCGTWSLPGHGGHWSSPHPIKLDL
jgi:hypothetical protein